MNKTLSFDPLNRFVIPDYTEFSPFSSFLPGIAGPMGIPMWVFYTNRGQAIAGFGVESKDTPIMEFQPANKAYQIAPYTGFRTFINVGGTAYEPFSPFVAPGSVQREMHIGMNEVEISEVSVEHGLQINVLYFNLTNEPFAGLVRQVSITNTGRSAVDLSLLDGLAIVVPYGVNDWTLKNMARTAEAWMGVFNVDQNIPFYAVRSSIGDRVEIEGYRAGHFYLTFTEEGRLPALVDPQVVFGTNTTLSEPNGFLLHGLDRLYQTKQILEAKTPCGFFGTEKRLAPGQTLTLYGVIGHIADMESLNREADRISTQEYIETKHHEANALIDQLTNAVAIKTCIPLLDGYTRQTFLDNVLRGGWPILLGDPDQPIVQHIYSRKHGDLERDYNAYYLAPEFYSQGNGNYRDVNQNRREDVWLNPKVGDFNIVSFMNLLQADGYNPLVIYGNRFSIPPEKRAAVLEQVEDSAALETVLSRLFTPGELLKVIQVTGAKLRGTPESFLATVLSLADHQFEAVFGEGYWVDHWTYNLDLVENYLAIYPEQAQDLLFGRPVFTFYDSPAVVRPRSEKYVLLNGRVRQYSAVLEDEEKQALIKSRKTLPNVVRAGNGKGPIFQTTLYVKLLCLALSKFSTLDSAGMGVEMEAGKPGWYDALNGMPGLFGSSMPETFELLRLIEFIRAITPAQGQIELPVEVYDTLEAVTSALNAYNDSKQMDRDYVYWDAASTVRETYRARVRLGFDGKLTAIRLADLGNILALFEAKVQAGIARALELNGGIPPTYFTYEVEDYEILDPKRQTVRVKKFSPVVLPLFLEGPVRALKIMTDHDAASALHQQIRTSDLYDHELHMYKVNGPLTDQPYDIGRARAFTPGWLENESIWLHMEYKYLLSMLKAGLYAEFYDEFRTVLIPFQKPEIYGRSPLENSSFLASSAHPDAAIHGHGYVARLSGSTAEYLSILHLMMIGSQPFTVEGGQLRLTLAPALPSWLFDDDGTVTCTFLGTTTIVYHNPARRDTFGANAVQPQRFVLELTDGQQIEVKGAWLDEPYSTRVRSGEAATVHVYLQ